MKKVQITLDGTKDVYLKSKSYQNALGNEFEVVLNNIRLLINANIRVVIRLNQDVYNTEDLISLVEILEREFGHTKYFKVYNALLFSDQNKQSEQKKMHRYNSFMSLQELLLKKHLYPIPVLKKTFSVRHCMADSDIAVIISPEGKLGKCEHYTNKYMVGSIYHNDIDMKMQNKWKEKYNISEECDSCPLYPQCIRIKMCPEEYNQCTLIQSDNKIYLIKKAMRRTYHDFLKKDL